jgi:hypothetical protein
MTNRSVGQVAPQFATVIAPEGTVTGGGWPGPAGRKLIAT